MICTFSFVSPSWHPLQGPSWSKAIALTRGTCNLQFQIFCHYAKSFESFIAFRMFCEMFPICSQLSLTYPTISNFETHSHKNLKWSNCVGEYLFLKGVLISKEKSTPGSTYFLGNKYKGVLISWEISTGEYLFTEYFFNNDTGRT